jgi:3-mercaptopyruvate sulfurtransferase SseA
MREQKKKTSRFVAAVLCAALTMVMLTIHGCGNGGTSSYTDPVTTTKSAALIDATLLKGWIDEGKLNAPFGSKDRVVLVSAASLTSWYAGHIPGAVRWDTGKIAEDGRTEGLGTTTALTPSGATMDAQLQSLGIDGNTTIVITIPANSGTSGFYSQAVLYWDLRYWGFPRERLKILNGGDDAWLELAGTALVTDPVESYQKSTYSVAGNAGLVTAVRYSVGQMLAKVDDLATPAVQDQWQLIDVRGPKNNYLKNALRLSGPTQFMTATAGKNYKYPQKADLTDPTTGLLATRAVFAQGQVSTDTPSALVSATKKTVVMCAGSTSAAPSFVMFDAVLGLPEGSIGMYDGSYSQWSNYNDTLLTAKYPSATAAQIDAWSFSKRYTHPADAAADLPTALPATGFTWTAPSLVNGPAVPGMSNQIETADRAYLQSIKATKTTNGSGGGSQLGC